MALGVVEPSPSSLNGKGGCGIRSASLTPGSRRSALSMEAARRRGPSKFGVLLIVRVLPDELEGRDSNVCGC